MKVFAPTDISIITTYRCPMQCKMCNIWKIRQTRGWKFNRKNWRFCRM